MIDKIEALGGILVKSFHLFALFVIGGTVSCGKSGDVGNRVQSVLQETPRFVFEPRQVLQNQHGNPASFRYDRDMSERTPSPEPGDASTPKVFPLVLYLYSVVYSREMNHAAGDQT